LILAVATTVPIALIPQLLHSIAFEQATVLVDALSGALVTQISPDRQAIDSFGGNDILHYPFEQLLLFIECSYPMKPAKTIDIAQFRQIGLFRTLDDMQLQHIKSLFKMRHYPKGQTLFFQGDPGDCLFVVNQGRLRIALTSAEGREVTVRVYGSGSVVGELAVIDGQPRSASAVAIDPCDTLVLYRSDFLALLRTNFELTENLLMLLAERVRYTTNYSEQLVFLSATGRIASALIQIASVEAGISEPVRLEVTQQELANFAGTAREWANRALQEFAEAGLIGLERGAVVVLDRAGLQRRIG
jgi:CRP/FNR family transcriptional regulator, cyclic AMP receptor protein